MKVTEEIIHNSYNLVFGNGILVTGKRIKSDKVEELTSIDKPTLNNLLRDKAGNKAILRDRFGNNQERDSQTGKSGYFVLSEPELMFLKTYSLLNDRKKIMLRLIHDYYEMLLPHHFEEFEKSPDSYELQIKQWDINLKRLSNFPKKIPLEIREEYKDEIKPSKPKNIVQIDVIKKTSSKEISLNTHLILLTEKLFLYSFLPKNKKDTVKDRQYTKHIIDEINSNKIFSTTRIPIGEIYNRVKNFDGYLN